MTALWLAGLLALGALACAPSDPATEEGRLAKGEAQLDQLGQQAGMVTPSYSRTLEERKTGSKAPEPAVLAAVDLKGAKPHSDRSEPPGAPPEPHK